MRFPRSAGILLHITSLPSPDGIGDLGQPAHAFVDFLAAAGQRVWQILPLGPPAEGNSPYSAFSAFAGNPLLISLPGLIEEGLLSTTDVPPSAALATASDRVDYTAVAAYKLPRLRTAFENFQQHASTSLRAELATFCTENAWWLTDYCRFESLMLHFGNPDWTTWDPDLVQRSEVAIANWDRQLEASIEYSRFVQFLFDRQWKRLKKYANERDIQMYGDMPIFVAHESADVWANQRLFTLNQVGEPELVAGVPPDYFSATGQLWGNPLYRWDVLETENYAWWTSRFGAALRHFDLLRVDHFRGFESYWEIPADAETAVAGQWRPGPGEKPFLAARAELGELPIIAEDLGLITDEVHQLRERLGFPGMRVLQFGFATEEDAFHRPSHYPPHSVAYTGTHDNDTLMGWYRQREPIAAGIDPLEAYLQGNQPIHIQLIQAVLDSPADTAIVPMQDVLGLGNEARMNIPGQAKGNWTWRVAAESLTPDLARQWHERTQRAKRL